MKPQRCQNNTKFNARFETVVHAYKVLHNGRMPHDKQYWTLCSEQLDNPLSEIRQMIDEDIITEEQWYGVDYDEDTIEANKKRFPRSTWLTGTFYRQISSAPVFNPGIIYYDTTAGIEKEVENLARLLKLMTTRDITDVLIVFNVVMDHRGVKYTINQILDTVENCKSFMKVVGNDDKINIDYDKGTYKNGATTMFTMFFTR